MSRNPRFEIVRRSLESFAVMRGLVQNGPDYSTIVPLELPITKPGLRQPE